MDEIYKENVKNVLEGITDHKLCDNLPTMVWLSDHQANLVYCNEECCLFTGIPLEELKKQSFVQCIYPDDVSVFSEMASEALSTNLPASCELRIKRYDGQFIWHLLRCQLCFENRLWAGVNINIHEKKVLETEQRKLQLENERIEKERLLAIDLVATRMEFFAKMSHEIRTPIHGILGSVDILQDLSLSIEQKKWINIISVSGQNLLTTINDILDFSKIESGKFDLYVVEFETEKLLYAVESVLMSMCIVKKLNLHISCEENFPKILKGDVDRIRQILINFASNAIKFTPENGTISIKLISLGIEQKDDMKIVKTKFIVEDTGIGIKESKLKLLFNPFVQEDSSISKRFGGTGLGLAICKNLAELMNGHVGVSSVLGKGSLFFLEIPLEIPDEKEKKINLIDDVTLRKDIAKLKWVILLAEDNIVNQMIAEKNLAKYGIHVIVAQDGMIALEKFKAISYDAILMDCHMPNMDGYQCTREIRKYENENNLSRIPIIACTASVMKEEVEMCRKIGMDEICPKPFNVHDLVLILRNLIKHN